MGKLAGRLAALRGSMNKGVLQSSLQSRLFLGNWLELRDSCRKLFALSRFKIKSLEHYGLRAVRRAKFPVVSPMHPMRDALDFIPRQHCPLLLVLDLNAVVVHGDTKLLFEPSAGIGDHRNEQSQPS